MGWKERRKLQQQCIFEHGGLYFLPLSLLRTSRLRSTPDLVMAVDETKSNRMLLGLDPSKHRKVARQQKCLDTVPSPFGLDEKDLRSG